MHDHSVAVNWEVRERRGEMATEKTKPSRRLRGHKDTATCCIASSTRPDIVVTSGEDGRLCWFDLRCREAQLVMDVSEEPISSVCFRPGNEDIIYVSSGKEVKCFDVNLATSWKPLDSYNYNKEDINQIVCNSKSSFLAAADDSGDVKVSHFCSSLFLFFPIKYPFHLSSYFALDMEELPFRKLRQKISSLGTIRHTSGYGVKLTTISLAMHSENLTNFMVSYLMPSDM